MSKQEPTYTVEYEVYNVSEMLESVEDKGWHEYRVKLKAGTRVVDMWDSRVETYNGVEHQRCSYKGATEAAEEIKEDVEKNGKAEYWFDVPKQPTEARSSNNEGDQ